MQKVWMYISIVAASILPLLFPVIAVLFGDTINFAGDQSKVLFAIIPLIGLITSILSRPCLKQTDYIIATVLMPVAVIITLFQKNNGFVFTLFIIPVLTLILSIVFLIKKKDYVVKKIALIVAIMLLITLTPINIPYQETSERINCKEIKIKLLNEPCINNTNQILFQIENGGEAPVNDLTYEHINTELEMERENIPVDVFLPGEKMDIVIQSQGEGFYLIRPKLSSGYICNFKTSSIDANVKTC